MIIIIRIIKLLVSALLGAPIIDWLQPPIYAGIAVGTIIAMIVDISLDNALRSN